MKKLLLVIIALFAMLPAVFAQDTDRAVPESGDIHVGIGWGWWLTRWDNSCHTKPIIPIGLYADYTFMTFADGNGSLAGGLLFEFCNYETWSTDDQIALVGFKTTTTWTRGLLAAHATARYCFPDTNRNWAVLGRVFLGQDLELGYKEKYSDESYASIIPHTNGPGSHGSFGFALGLDTMVTEHLGLTIQLGLGTYSTIGFITSYKF